MGLRIISEKTRELLETLIREGEYEEARDVINALIAKTRIEYLKTILNAQPEAFQHIVVCWSCERVFLGSATTGNDHVCPLCGESNAVFVKQAVDEGDDLLESPHIVTKIELFLSAAAQGGNA